MNLHMPQSHATRAELLTLTAVSKNIQSAQASKPVNGLVQDGLCGVRMMTKRDTFLTKETMMNLLLWLKSWDGRMPPPAIVKPVPLWTGKQLFSMFIPKIDIMSYHSTHSLYDEEFKKKMSPTEKEKRHFQNLAPFDTKVIIDDGELISGIICKRTVGTSAGGIVHVIWSDYGSDAARDFIDFTSQVVNQWLLHVGFSVGLGDCVVNEETATNVVTNSMKQFEKVYETLSQYSKGSLAAQGTLTAEDTKENHIQNHLSKARDMAGKQVNGDLPGYNNFKQMSEAGSKGSVLNLTQIAGNVGQQLLEGKRIPLGFRNRTLPHFSQYDDGPASRGYVLNSFIRGLTPNELFFHAMGGREGLIDTAVKTATTGYIQRRLVKALEDISVQYDGTVRNCRGDVIQFYYGEDGFDGSVIENQVFETMLLNDEKFEKLYRMKNFENTEWKQLQEDREFLRLNLRNADDRWPLPMNLKRMIIRSQKLNPKGELPDVEYIYHTVQKLRTSLKPSQLVLPSQMNPSMLFSILLSSTLSTKQVLERHKLTKKGFDWLISEIRRRYVTGLIQPGESVGVIAAQSIGEPATQMTLNSVEYNTEILLKIDNEYKRIKIGEYIDDVLNYLIPEDIENHPNDTKLGWIKEEDVQILSCDESGKVTWKKIEAVTRHPVINKDKTDTLLKVTLKSGREVTATKGKSFLKRIDNKIVPVDGDTLKVGDYLPVSDILPISENSVSEYLDLRTILPEDEWVYMSEVKKAFEWRKKNPHHWWSKGLKKHFTVPHKRADSFLCGYGSAADTKSYKVQERDKAREKYPQLENCVYPLHLGFNSSNIPEKIPLTEDFGWFCGAYLAEGNCTSHHVMISNLDDDFNNRVIKFCALYNLSFHIQERIDKRGHSKSIRIHSLVFTKIIMKLFGTGSGVKRIPINMVCANLEFLKGMVAGYIDGDGWVMENGTVVASSISQGMLTDFQQILVRFGIRTKITAATMEAWRKTQERFAVASRNYVLSLPSQESKKFAKIFVLTISEKNKRLEINFTKKNYDSGIDMVPNVVLSTGDQNIFRRHFPKLLSSAISEKDKKILQDCLEQNIIYDEIISIEEIRSEFPSVYDFTVQDTKTFSTYNGVCQFDTFHLSGTGNKTVTSGIPRLTELINAVKNLKTPSMTIYLEEPYKSDKTLAHEVKARLEHTTLQHLVKTTKIYYDPDFTNTVVKEDVEWLKILNDIPDPDLPVPSSLHPWVLRYTFDRKELAARDLMMDDLVDKIDEIFKTDIFTQHASDNNEELVLHVRVYKDDDEESANEQSCEQFLQTFKEEILCAVTVCGIPGIEKAFVSEKPIAFYDTEGNLDQKKREYIIETDGINMQDTMCVEGVDSSRLYCNDPQEMASLFGIEVSRSSLVEEIRGVIESGGSYINYRHLSLLCDLMTSRGTIMSITRHGVNSKSGAGALKKCTFEQTVDILLDAAVNGELDNVKGVSEACMLGKVMKVGSGACDLILDEEMLKSAPGIGPDDPLPDSISFEQMRKEKETLESSKHQIVLKHVVEKKEESGYSPFKPSYLR